MSIVTTPTSITLYVQWKLHPFESPQTAEQKKENSKYALQEVKKGLKEVLESSDDLRLIYGHNGSVSLIIENPESDFNSNYKLWEKIFNLLKDMQDIKTIHIFVNNDTSEKIALNLADRVPHPWHQGYKGQGLSTLIFHK